MDKPSELVMTAIQTAVDAYPAYLIAPVRKLYSDIAAGKEKPAIHPGKWTVEQLLTHTFTGPKWIVQGYIPVGLTILAGRPKVGKSWLALQLARDAAKDGIKSLYIALEDSPRRIQERIELQGFASDSNLEFVFEMPALSNGGQEWFETEQITNSYQLIIIDTFGRASNGLDDMQDMSEMTKIMGGLQRMAMDNDSAVLLIDHHKKPSGMGADPIDDILGSTGKAAVCDCAMGLYKEHGKGGATLKITGRDMEARDEALSWNGLKCEWEFEGDAYLVRANSEKGRILDAIQAISNEGTDPTVKAISKRTGMAASNVSDSIRALVRDGAIYRGQKKGVSQPYYPSKAVPA